VVADPFSTYPHLSPSIATKRKLLAVDVTVSLVYAVKKANSIRRLLVPATIEWE
jgi:hypothetical protein